MRSEPEVVTFLQTDRRIGGIAELARSLNDGLQDWRKIGW
jgi:hypothetical protein